MVLLGALESPSQFWRITKGCGLPRSIPRGPATNVILELLRGSMSSLTTTHAPKGLEGVVATTSSICYIDGEQGVLAYRGIDIHDLADHSNFEETCYLLWFGDLPKRNELRELRERLAEERKLDASILNLLRVAPKHALPMDVLRTAVSALSFYDPEFQKNDHDANVHKAIRLTSQIAMIVAAYDRIRKGKEVVEPDRTLSHAANFLLMLNGTAALADRGACSRYCPDPARRSRTERVDVCGARDGCHAVRHALGHHLGHRRPEGATARRRQRSGIPHSDGD